MNKDKSTNDICNNIVLDLPYHFNSSFTEIINVPVLNKRFS